MRIYIYIHTHTHTHRLTDTHTNPHSVYIHTYLHTRMGAHEVSNLDAVQSVPTGDTMYTPHSYTLEARDSRSGGRGSGFLVHVDAGSRSPTDLFCRENTYAYTGMPTHDVCVHQSGPREYRGKKDKRKREKQRTQGVNPWQASLVLGI